MRTHNLILWNLDHTRILSRIARTLQGISLLDVPKNSWTELSTWRDFQALIRTGTATLLSVHRVVEQIESDFGMINEIDATLKMIDDNGNVEIIITEDTKDMFQGFTVNTRRRCLKRLKDI